MPAKEEENLMNGNDIPDFTYTTDDKSETVTDASDLSYSEQMEYKESAEK